MNDSKKVVIDYNFKQYRGRVITCDESIGITYFAVKMEDSTSEFAKGSVKTFMDIEVRYVSDDEFEALAPEVM